MYKIIKIKKLNHFYHCNKFSKGRTTICIANWVIIIENSSKTIYLIFDETKGTKRYQDI